MEAITYHRVILHPQVHITTSLLQKWNLPISNTKVTVFFKEKTTPTKSLVWGIKVDFYKFTLKENIHPKIILQSGDEFSRKKQCDLCISINIKTDIVLATIGALYILKYVFN